MFALRHKFRVAWVCLLLCSAPPVSVGGTETLARRLQPLIDDHAGQVAVAVEHLQTHEQFQHRSQEPMPTASLIKFPVMIEAFRQQHAGLLDFDKQLTLREEDKVPGAGILTPHFSAGARFTLRDAVRLMIAFSDNTATNMVIDEIGLDSTSRTMEQLGFAQTRLHSKVYRRDTSIAPDRSQQFGLGSTTAGEMLGLLKLLHERRLISPTASDDMRAHLLTCDDQKKFPRFLPEEAKVAFKTGSVEAARTAAGIVETPTGPVALCVLTNENDDHRWTDDNAGDLLCARIAREVYDYFSPVEAKGPEMEEGCGDLPPRVSSAATSRDGDGDDEPGFDREPTPAAATPKPLAARSPPDALSGVPFTSCQAWAVADAKTGNLLWHNDQASAVREVASTTKIMTAFVALRVIRQDPHLIDATVTFDEQSDQTPGSSAGLQAGDQLPFRDLLFALLLPSGNDAAVAVARFLGGRFDPPGKSKSADSLARFIAEMNREAGRLGLKQTHYVNPHGLPQKKHSSSARDLIKLTQAALQDPLFRQIVSTREHGAQVQNGAGKSRTVTWRNTNRLLAIEGFQGVKTGYTRAAGSCLVSTGVRGKDQLIVVVLGAPSAAAAVSDSRNLYRYAWNERGHRN